ncbi:MAG: glycosyltransferase family 4 protein [Terricaulis sp.]
MVASGGLLRLERLGEALGCECAYLLFAPHKTPEFKTRFSVLTWDEAAPGQWSAVLVPGAGFPDKVIESFARLSTANFGTRVQMILNDPHKTHRFLRVNAAFNPHLVLFNNPLWTPGSYSAFRAKHFHELIGAVDTTQFTPRGERQNNTRFIVGGQVSKNPAPLIDAMDLLPNDCALRLFGIDRTGVAPFASARLGNRFEYVGPLFGDQLASYYHGLDAVISTETTAGWANVVAEAMASGVPVVTTPAGTASIARHEVTAIVMDYPDPSRIAAAISRLKDDALLGARLAKSARQHIEAYNWRDYAAQFVELVAITATDAG